MAGTDSRTFCDAHECVELKFGEQATPVVRSWQNRAAESARAPCNWGLRGWSEDHCSGTCVGFPAHRTRVTESARATSTHLHCVDVYAAQIANSVGTSKLTSPCQPPQPPTPPTHMKQPHRVIRTPNLSEANFHFFRCAQFRQLFNGLTAVEIIDIVIVKFNAVGVLVGVTSV